jgi:large subunit ribosomal protein L25
MADAALKIEKRSDSGKVKARRLRKTGKIPAIIYGEDQETTSLMLDRHAFEMMLKQHHTLVHLDLDGTTIDTIVRDIQRHPVSGNILHVDFFTVKKGHKLTLSVSLNYKGTAIGTKTGGIFQSVKNDIEISVLPKDIPNYIEVDISHLEIGDNIRVKDILQDNIEFLDDPEDVICGVQAPRSIEEVEAEEELEEEESAEPEVITARDKDEEETDSE